MVHTDVMLSPAVSQYYDRYYATNADGEVWATNSMPFSTASVWVCEPRPTRLSKDRFRSVHDFIARRTPPAIPMVVTYTMSGTATAGVDYDIPASATIPSGASNAEVFVTP